MSTEGKRTSWSEHAIIWPGKCDNILQSYMNRVELLAPTSTVIGRQKTHPLNKLQCIYMSTTGNEEKNGTYCKNIHGISKSLNVRSAASLAAENLPSETRATRFSFLLQGRNTTLLLPTFQQLTYYAVWQWLRAIGYQLRQDFIYVLAVLLAEPFSIR